MPKIHEIILLEFSGEEMIESVFTKEIFRSNCSQIKESSSSCFRLHWPGYCFEAMPHVLAFTVEAVTYVATTS